MKLLKPEEVAGILGCSKRTVYRMVENGIIPALDVPMVGLRVKEDSLRLVANGWRVPQRQAASEGDTERVLKLVSAAQAPDTGGRG